MYVLSAFMHCVYLHVCIYTHVCICVYAPTRMCVRLCTCSVCMHVYTRIYLLYHLPTHPLRSSQQSERQQKKRKHPWSSGANRAHCSPTLSVRKALGPLPVGLPLPAAQVLITVDMNPAQQANLQQTALPRHTACRPLKTTPSAARTQRKGSARADPRPPAEHSILGSHGA